MDIETRKWCQTTWLINPLAHWYAHCPTSVMTWPWPDLTWGQILKSIFQGQRNMLRTGSMSQTWWCYFFRFSHITKVISSKPSFWKRIIFPFDDLWRQNCRPKVNYDRKTLLGHEKSYTMPLGVLPTYHPLRVDNNCFRKKIVFSKI